MAVHALTFRRIDLATDSAVAFENYRDACAASFGSADSSLPREKYLSWVADRLGEFPDGNVLASIGDRFVGQLELQIPYGLQTGYVNLFYVTRPWRRLGLGRRMHDFADRYFRSWEATAVELHVSPTNTAAVGFYRSLGYRKIATEDEGGRMWKMRREIASP
jgi:ribosomal protein S18 acetylase RimI-like enzyme